MLAERIASARLAELAAAGTCLADSIPPAGLPRLAGVLADAAGSRLDVSLRLRAGPEALPVAELRVTGLLSLPCQRCLCAMPWAVDFEVALTAVPDEAAADGLADPFDSVLLDADGALPLWSMVEDEILAMLPLAPVHGDAGVCVPADDDGAGEAVDQGVAPRVNLPFARLAALQAEAGRKKQ